jgi:hypothetical protein
LPNITSGVARVHDGHQRKSQVSRCTVEHTSRKPLNGSTPGRLLKALLIQLSGLSIIACGYLLLPYETRTQLTLLHMTLLLGALAFALSRRFGLPFRWQVLQLFLPVALLLASALQLPAVIPPAVLFILLGFFWPILKDGAPLFSSGQATWDEVSRRLPSNGSRLRVLDAGSGTGGLIMALASSHPDATIVGVETACIPWLISKMRIALRRSHASVRFTNYQHIDFGHYDVVFTYLSPACMPDIWLKAKKEMRAHSLLLSYEFAIPGAEPDFRCYPAPDSPPLLGWRIPKSDY